MHRATKSLVRPFSSSVRARGVWSDFSKRPETLKLVQNDAKSDIFEGIDPSKGPHLIGLKEAKMAYHSPENIDSVFKQAYSLLESESAAIYAKMDAEKDQKIKDQLQIDAEKQNPEVLYNVKYNLESVDASQPVYRHFLKEKWELYGLLVLMQRLEQMKAIPDTLATLVPKTDLKVKFPHNTEAQFAGWVEPGTILPAFAVSQPPVFQIQEFESVPENQLYTLLVVNPDTPDLETNSFSTTLHYGLSNVSQAQLNAGDRFAVEEAVFREYVPVLPEKNAQNQRAVVWLFRQEGQVTVGPVEAEKFEIRAFVDQHKLVAVGAHIWRQHFDRSTNGVRADYGLGKGRVFHRVRRTHPVV